MHEIYIDDKKIEDVLILSLGLEQISALDYEKVSVFGRNGDFFVDKQKFKGYKRKIRLLFHEKDKIDTVVSQFFGIKKKIKFSDNEKFFFYFSFLEEIVIVPTVDKFIVEIELEIEPFKYFVEEKNYTFSSNTSIENVGNVFSEPKITIYGTGNTSFSLGKQTMRFKIDEKLVIECRHGEQNLYDKDGNVANSRLLGGSFFEVPPGLRGVALGDGITRVEVEMRCRNR